MSAGSEVLQTVTACAPGTKREYMQEMSQFLPRHSFVREAARDFRWIHIDGEHSAQAVSNDLALAEMLLSDRGILHELLILFTALENKNLKTQRSQRKAAKSFV